MKFRSLFLASLAAMAFASCSNEEEATTAIDGEVSQKEAIVQFGIAFAASETRVATTGTDEKGVAAENTFVDATIVINQGINKNVLTFAHSDFRQTSDETSPSILWLKEKIGVQAGAADVYVFLNASADLKARLQSTAFTSYASLKETVDFSTGIGALEGDGKIAESGKFLMCNESGTSTPADPIFTVNEVNQLTVKVARVAAKLEEKTRGDNNFDVTNDLTNQAGKALKVQLTGFAYAGLQQDSWVLKNTNPIAANLYQPYGPRQDYAYQPINGNQANYCMENLAITPTNWSTTTNIVYKGKITVDGEAVPNLYVTPDMKAFTSIADMEEAGIKYAGITENSSIDDCLAVGLKKYENGICYYVAKIETANEGAIIKRNNIYRLSVNSIANIGMPLPEDTPDPTLLSLTVEITPWTVNLNSFDL